MTASEFADEKRHATEHVIEEEHPRPLF